MKTNDLRELVQAQLLTVCENSYYEQALEDNYPRCIFNFENINLGDLSRDDVMLTVDVWDRGKSSYAIENLCDSIERLFNNSNLPQDSILPTFFRDSRNSVKDEDKNLKHRVLKFQIQNYERN